MFIFPNPIEQNTTLEYTHRNEEHISIELLDAQGKTVKVFAHNQLQEAGEHQLPIVVAGDLAAGSYFIVISSLDGSGLPAGRQVSVQVVKE